jgi:DNA polymerase-3 subunit beta
MIVSCDREKLNSLVQTALRGVSSRVTMPILSGLLINAEGGQLVASSTDLELSIRAQAEATVTESGSTVVSGKLLGDIMKSLPPGDVTVESGEKYLIVRSTSGEYRIKELMPEDFPQIPLWSGDAVFKVPGGFFISAIQQTSRASSSDEKRPVLTGSLIEKNLEVSGVRMVATDSYRLAWRDIEVSGSVAGWEDCIIPTKTLNEVARLAGGTDADVEIRMQDKQAMFRIGTMVVTSRLIEGQFPNYKQLIPKGEKTSVVLAKEDLIAVVRRAMIFGHNIRFGVYSDHLKLNTETPEVGDSKEEIGAEVTGEEMEIGFNAGYLLDGVTAVDTEKIEMRLDDPQKPALIKDFESEGFKYIIMPVRLR